MFRNVLVFEYSTGTCIALNKIKILIGIKAKKSTSERFISKTFNIKHCSNVTFSALYRMRAIKATP
jgi:hypothetical protein